MILGLRVLRVSKGSGGEEGNQETGLGGPISRIQSILLSSASIQIPVHASLVCYALHHHHQ